jgi:hypothetical protein
MAHGPNYRWKGGEAAAAGKGGGQDGGPAAGGIREETELGTFLGTYWLRTGPAESFT